MPGRGTGTPDLMQLLEQAYRSAFEPCPFASLVPALMTAIGADTGHVNVWAAELGGELAVCHQLPEHLIRAYRQHYWKIDVWREAIERKKVPVGRAFTGRSILPYRELIKSEMYNGALREYGLFDTCAGHLYQRGRDGGAISLLRARGRPFYGRREVGLLGALMPHMARAFDLRLRLDGLARQRDAFAAFVDRLADGALLVDGDGRVLHASDKARALLDAPDGPLRLERGRLTARDPAADRRLQKLFAERGGIVRWAREPATIEIAAPGRAPSHRLKVVPSALAATVLTLGGFAVLIGIEACARPSDEPVARAARRYGLTPAEAELLRELAAGLSLPAAADKLARARSTVRNQLQAIFAKTGTHRQAQLVVKILQ